MYYRRWKWFASIFFKYASPCIGMWNPKHTELLIYCIACLLCAIMGYKLAYSPRHEQGYRISSKLLWLQIDPQAFLYSFRLGHVLRRGNRHNFPTCSKRRMPSTEQCLWWNHGIIFTFDENSIALYVILVWHNDAIYCQVVRQCWYGLGVVTWHTELSD